MSTESVSRAIVNATQRGPITAQSFAPVVEAIGRYQDEHELKAVSNLRASMNSGVIAFSADGFEAVERQIAKGDQVSTIIAERIDADPKARRHNRATVIGLAVGVSSLVGGIGFASMLAGTPFGWGLVGLAVAGLGVFGVSLHKVDVATSKIADDARASIPD